MLSADPEGGRDPEKHKNIELIAIMIRIPLKVIKLSSQHSFWAFNGTPAKRFAGGPILPAYSDIWLLPPPSTNKKVVKVGPTLTKLS